MNALVFPPNPRETVPPTDGFDAFSSALVGMTEEMPREVIKEHLKALDINSVVFTAMNRLGSALRGQEPGRELNPVERKFSDTIQYCAMHSLLGSAVEAVATIEAVRLEVDDGGVFVGEERPYDYYDRPDQAVAA